MVYACNAACRKRARFRALTQHRRPDADAPVIDARTAVFLDYDGTLTEIAERPHLATPPERMADLLSRLSAALDGALAILSGRPIAEIDGMLAPFQGAAAGVHGAERRIGGGPVEAVARAAVLAVAESVAAGLAHRHRGVLVENKTAAVAVHYRAAPEAAAECRSALLAVADAEPELQLIEGKMVLEIRLKGHDKGAALDWFMARPPFAGRRPLVVGDDVTDEDAFRAARAMGGDAVKVGPGETVANYRLPGPAAVRQLLEDALAHLERPI